VTALTSAGLGKDPLIGQSFFLEIQGKITGLFTTCSGFTSSNEVLTEKYSDPQGRTLIRKIPGKITYNNITLAKGITDNLDLWKWMTLVVEGKIDEARSNGTISLCDPTGSVVAQWQIEGVWPVRVNGPSLTAEGGKVGVEEVELTLEGFRRIM
jgi:phage tail-like protein